MTHSASPPLQPSRVDDLIRTLGGVGLAVVAAALPWELFQRIPDTGLTLVKLGSGAAIIAAILSWLRSRGASFPRTGLLPCIALFALAALISAIQSQDASATNALLRVYAGYAAFFFAMATFNRTPQAALRLAVLYVLSAAVVAVMTLLASGGFLWPVRWDTAFWPQQRLLHEFRDGQPMRIAAANADFNQASLHMLIALSLVLFVRGATRLKRVVRVVLGGVFMAAIALSMSRSGIAIGGALIVGSILTRTRGRIRVAAIAALIFVTAATAWLAGDFASMLATRAQGGTVYEEGSADNRVEVYRIALALAPRYALSGAGLGASEAAVQQSEYARGEMMAIHSMPLLLTIELGLLGLVAYSWLWWRTFRFGAWPLLTADDLRDGGIGGGFAAASGATFAMLLAQPFMILPLYPFLLALGFGPIAGKRSSGLRLPSSGRADISVGLVGAAVVVTLAIALENCWAFQHTASRTEAFADTLEAGLRAQEAGHSGRAASLFVQAEEPLAKHLDHKPYFGEAEALIDLQPLYESLGVRKPSSPEAVAWFAEGRALLARGNLDDAGAVLRKAWSLDAQFEYMHFHLAEAYWGAGRPREALRHYRDFNALTRAGGGSGADLREAIVPEPTDQEASTLRVILQRAAYARRDGRWGDAVVAAREALASDARCAEAHYLLGVNAEISGESPDTHYRAALDALPNHYLAKLAHDRVARSSD